MNETVEVLGRPSVNLKIADMPPWYLWARPETLGATDEEVKQFDKITQERRIEIGFQMKHACEHLRDVVPPGVQEWMTTRRARN